MARQAGQVARAAATGLAAEAASCQAHYLEAVQGLPAGAGMATGGDGSGWEEGGEGTAGGMGLAVGGDGGICAGCDVGVVVGGGDGARSVPAGGGSVATGGGEGSNTLRRQRHFRRGYRAVALGSSWMVESPRRAVARLAVVSAAMPGRDGDGMACGGSTCTGGGGTMLPAGEGISDSAGEGGGGVAPLAAGGEPRLGGGVIDNGATGGEVMVGAGGGCAATLAGG